MNTTPVLASWLLLVAALAVATAGQEPTSPAADTTAQSEEAREEGTTLDELRALVERQQALLEEQQRRLDEQAQRLEEQQNALAEQARAVRDLLARLETMEPRREQLSEAEVSLLEGLERLEGEEEKDRDRPQEVAVAGEFPGSIRVPGTNMAFRLGGFVATNIVFNSQDLEQEDRFVTADIPVGGVASGTTLEGFNVSVRRSRLDFDWRMDSTVGQFRAYVEGDFLGDGTAFRLRHAYGQYKGVLMGQTWSTLVDPYTGPEEIDLEGINGQILVRQPLARLRWGRVRGFDRALGIENPAPEVSGGRGLTQVPDLVYRLGRKDEKRSLHLAAIVRMIRAEPDDSPGRTKETLGLGAVVSSQLPVRFLDERNNVRIQGSYGAGLGRYVVDLAAAGDQDAVVDPETGDLKALHVFAGYLSYQHWWPLEWREIKSLRSNFTFGWVNVWNRDCQPDDAYKRTFRFQFSTLWSPIPRLDLGVEYLWGRREDKNGEHGLANQIQAATYFRF